MKRKRERKVTQTAVPTSSSPDDGVGRGYEVFLSFRGPDSRLTIADTLYNDLIRAGIRAFKDNEELRFGEEIEGGLLQAINESIIYIPILSKDYASSKWCLRELAHIVELSRDNDEKVILPIFYEVDADDVKLKTKLYRKALRKHKIESGKDLARRWKKALREVARISGRNLKDHGIWRYWSSFDVNHWRAWWVCQNFGNSPHLTARGSTKMHKLPSAIDVDLNAIAHMT